VTYAWATPGAQLLMYIGSAIPALIVATIVAIPLVIASGGAVGADGAIPPQLELTMLLTAIVVQFPAWILFVVLWVRLFERRSLASAGFRGPQPVRQYLVGLAAGVGVAVALAALSPFVQPPPELDAEIVDFDLSRLLAADWLLTMVGVTGMFLLQGAGEEVACRGWMMSAVAARRGLVTGIWVNVLVFASLHIQLFREDMTEVGALFVAALVVVTFTGWLGRWGLIGSLAVCALGLVSVPWSLTVDDLIFGIVGMSAIACVGLFLSLWAVAERSIAGVCGVHGAFNATIVVFGLAAGAATDPEASPGKVLLDTIKAATALSGEANVTRTLVQLGLFAALSALVWQRLRRRR
jgi:membrane protease YdiL (CAAX protease family)